MHKTAFTAILAILLLGCSPGTAAVPESTAPSAAPAVTQEMEGKPEADGYENYRQAIEGAWLPDHYSAGVTRSYDMSYDSGAVSAYDMDGLYEESPDLIHFRQNMNADGLQSNTEGWYENGRLYMTYNGVSYYEDMDRNAVRDVIMVPLGLQAVSKEAAESITVSENGSGTEYTVTLTAEGARKLFDSRYDIYGLSQYPDYRIAKAVITQTVNGTVPVSEKTEFVCVLETGGVGVTVTSRSGAEYITGTTLSLTDQLRDAFAKYVRYTDIDTSKITDADITSDLPEDTVTDTLKKRLIHRLNYELQEDGSYLAKFNENETYRFDFTNHVFTYTNRSSRYIYNWKGDLGGFGNACSLDFSTGRVSEDCDESVQEMIRRVKTFMAMELYYCGVSLEDLRKEA